MKTTRLRLLAMLLAAATLFAALPSHAATLVIVNNDGAGEGFNDPTPAAPVGGNPGTTVGQQRLNLFQYAANIWGALLPSTVTIQVRSQFNPQTCTATSAVLGSAGPVTIHRDFAGALYPGTWYHAALANRLNFTDLSAANPDINATFNSNINGSATCLGGTSWYYGFDGLEPALTVELLPVLLHEMGHGLGFSTNTSGTTGNFNSGFPSVFDHFMYDNTTGLVWSAMTPAQRVASAIGVDKLAWNGPAVFNGASTFLGKRPRMVINSPGGIAGTYQAGAASFGAALTVGGLTGDVVLVDDGVAPGSDGCSALINGAAVAGNIALIDRGTCAFILKAQAAQAAGATGILMANNVAGIQPPGGVDPSITIPVIGISLADGNTIKANLGGGVNVTIGLDPTLMAGADNSGRPLMYTPNPFQSGSSVSHFDVSLFPNALMEPAINGDLSDDVDLTYNLFGDIGWFDYVVSTRLAFFTAEDRTEGIEVAWEFADMRDVSVIQLQRAPAQVGPWEAVSADYATDGTRTTALDRAVEAGSTYFYRLAVTERNGDVRNLGLAAVQRGVGGVGSAQLFAASPNPAPKATTLGFRISRPEFVRLQVVDAAGRRVRTLHEGMLAAGEHAKFWDGADESGKAAPAGLYFGVMVTSEGRQSSRFALVR